MRLHDLGQGQLALGLHIEDYSVVLLLPAWPADKGRASNSAPGPETHTEVETARSQPGTVIRQAIFTAARRVLNSAAVL